jgi:hypothetical protein
MAENARASPTCNLAVKGLNPCPGKINLIKIEINGIPDS